MIKFIGVQGEAVEVATFLNNWNGATDYREIKEITKSEETKQSVETSEAVQEPKEQPVVEEKPKRRTRSKKTEEEILDDNKALDDALSSLPEKEEEPKVEEDVEAETVQETETNSNDEDNSEAASYEAPTFDEILENQVKPEPEEPKQPEQEKPAGYEYKYEEIYTAMQNLVRSVKTNRKKYPAPNTVVRAIAVVYGDSTFDKSIGGTKKEKYADVMNAISEKNRIQTLEEMLKLLEELGVEADPTAKDPETGKTDYKHIDRLYEIHLGLPYAPQGSEVDDFEL